MRRVWIPLEKGFVGLLPGMSNIVVISDEMEDGVNGAGLWWVHLSHGRLFWRLATISSHSSGNFRRQLHW